eukprot:1880122-Rhodomonas_salina.5
MPGYSAANSAMHPSSRRARRGACCFRSVIFGKEDVFVPDIVGKGFLTQRGGCDRTWRTSRDHAVSFNLMTPPTCMPWSRKSFPCLC